MTSPLGSQDAPVRWFYANSANQPVGPVTLEQLAELATSGVITTTTLIVAAGGSTWSAYADVMTAAGLPRPAAQPGGDQPPSPSSTAWFYTDAANKPVGPISSEQLTELATSGVVTTATLIAESGGSKWRPYAEVMSATGVPRPAQHSGAQPESLAQSVNSAAKLLGDALVEINKSLSPKAKKWLIIGAGVLFVLALLDDMVGAKDSGHSSPSSLGAKTNESKVDSSTANRSGKSPYDKRDIDVALMWVSDNAEELERLLDVAQNGDRITAQTLGEIKIWKSNVRQTRESLEIRKINQFGASGSLLMASINMESAWSSFEKNSTMMHASSLKGMRENLRDARAYIAEGKF